MKHDVHRNDDGDGGHDMTSEPDSSSALATLGHVVTFTHANGTYTGLVVAVRHLPSRTGIERYVYRVRLLSGPEASVYRAAEITRGRDDQDWRVIQFVGD